VSIIEAATAARCRGAGAIKSGHFIRHFLKRPVEEKSLFNTGMVYIFFTFSVFFELIAL
jgi:hypothetical protein